MAMLTATISGSLLRPDLTAGAMTVNIHAITDGTRLAYAGKVIAGRIPVKIHANGTARVTLPQIPQSGLTPTGALYRITFKTAYDVSHWDFTLTGDTTWDQIVDVSDVPITASIQAAAEAAATRAEAAAATLAGVSAVTWTASVSVKNPAYGSTGTADDTATFHAARDAAGAGGAVDVPAGTYLTGGLTLNAANQRWRLAPGAVIKLKNTSNTNLVTVTADGCTIEGGTLDGNRTNQTSNGYGIIANSRTGLTVRGVTMQNTRQEGVWLSGTSKATVEGCTLTNCGQAGNKKAIYADDALGSFSQIRVANNIIDGTTSQNGGVQIVSTTPGNTARDIVVSGNQIRQGDNAANILGVEFYSTLGGVIAGGTISHNVISAPGTGATNFGISLGGVATSATTGNFNVAVTGNSIRNCKAIGIELIGRGLSSVGNTLEGCGYMSVSSFDMTGDMVGVSIVGNVLRNPTSSNYAIQMLASATNQQRGTIVANNVVEGGAGPALTITGNVVDAHVVSNTFRRCVGAGVIVNASAVVTNTRIAGNRIDCSAQGASQDGINVASSAATDLRIEDNIITAATRYGIQTSAASVARISIVRNQVSGCASNGIMTAVGGDKFVIVGNHVHDNTGRGISLSGSPTLTTLSGNVAYSNVGGDIVTGGTFTANTLGGTTGTTAPGAGGAGALPATPAGYLTVAINGTSRQIPYY